MWMLAACFQGRVCVSLPPHPQLCRWVTYIWEKHRFSTPEMQGMIVPRKNILQIMGSHIDVSMLWLQGIFSVAQSCNHSSLIQSSPTEENPPHHPKQATAWERQEAPQGCIPAAECEEPLRSLRCRPSRSFPWAKHRRAPPVLPCSALRQAGKGRRLFLLKRCLLLPAIIITSFFFPFFSSSQNSHRQHLHNSPAYQLDILIAETAPTRKSC